MLLQSRLLVRGPKLPRQVCNARSQKSLRRLHVAVIGSGPAGFYTSLKVLQRVPDARIRMFEQLPVPFGLVRFGVAPDHPEVKNCQDKFDEVARSPQFEFLGNVMVGKDVDIRSISETHDAVVFAYGASKDRLLGIPSEDLDGIHSARAFVGWYNGLPEFANLNPDLDSEIAVIIGQGNVALDIARVLCSPVDRLQGTDISQHALDTLKSSRIKRVHIVGRRGLLQASFTIKEVRELLQLVQAEFVPFSKERLPESSASLPRAPKRIVKLLGEAVEKCSEPQSKKWSLDFMLAPQRFLEHSHDKGKVGAVEFARTVYSDPEASLQPSASVEKSNETITIPTSLVFSSIGYKCEPLPDMTTLGIQFDERRGLLVNASGRVRTGEGSPSKYYCAGWVKRGPTGVIASTMEDAFETAEALIADWNEGKLAPTPKSRGGSKFSGPEALSWLDWAKIDAEERKRGALAGKPREKITQTSELLEIARR